jgi:hypothetical protein
MSKKLTERIEELERRVRDLEARPQVVCPIILPQPTPIEPHYVGPQIPYTPPNGTPCAPFWWPQVTC